jgi:hypothetical protein
VIDIKVIDGLYVVQGPKCVLVLTKQEFIVSLRRGRWWKRRQALQARLTPTEAPRPVAGRRG